MRELGLALRLKAMAAEAPRFGVMVAVTYGYPPDQTVTNVQFSAPVISLGPEERFLLAPSAPFGRDFPCRGQRVIIEPSPEDLKITEVDFYLGDGDVGIFAAFTGFR